MKRLEEDGWELHGNVFVREDDDERYLPLYEAKLFHQYDHRFATFDGASERDIRNGNARPMTAEEKADPDSVVIPRYWVPEAEVAQRLNRGEASLSSIGRQGRQAVLRTLEKLAISSLSERSRERPTNARGSSP